MLKKWTNKINTLHVNSEGAEQVLGELEAKVMQIFWEEADFTTIKKVHQVISEERDLAYTTVQTIIDRLFQKGLLKKLQRGRSFIYAAHIDKNEFETQVSNKFIDAIAGNLNDNSLAYFVEVLDDVDKSKLEYLAKLIGQKLSGE